jgi:hypothetical protein
MNYLRCYQFLFDSPKWFSNLLAGTVALLVPIVGPIVFLGYQFEILEALHLHGEVGYPDFDTNRLSKYLMRGVWPFLVDMVVRLVFGMLMVPVVGVMVFVMIAAGGNDKEVGGVFLLVFACFYALLIIVVNLLLPLVLTPIVLRAGITQDFGAAFSLEFIKDFVGKMWVEMVLGSLFFGLTGTIILLIGLLACIVGWFPALAFVSFAHAYFLHQLYEVYLQRGGTEIPLKAEPTAY